jgi:bifunctional DNA-binding transcriptional regulator/antitoxin component of YhaV-PrlF toxin-antitoxin module
VKTIVDEIGRIQLPELVRTRLGVKPGDEVVLEEHAGEWILKSANTQTGLLWEGNVLVHKGMSMTSATIEDSIDEDRDERFRHLTRGFTE